MADLLIYLLENYANWIIATPFILAITYVIHGLFFSSELHPKIDPSLWRPATDEEIQEIEKIEDDERYMESFRYVSEDEGVF